MKPLTKDDADNLREYLQESLDTDDVVVTMTSEGRIRFQVPAHLCIEAGAAISVFLLDWPDMAPIGDVIINNLVVADVYHQMFPEIQTAIGFILPPQPQGY